MRAKNTYLCWTCGMGGYSSKDASGAEIKRVQMKNRKPKQNVTANDMKYNCMNQIRKDCLVLTIMGWSGHNNTYNHIKNESGVCVY